MHSTFKGKSRQDDDQSGFPSVTPSDHPASFGHTSDGQAMPESVSLRIAIQNRLGLHARPAMSFVDTAKNFESQVSVRKGEQVVDGKSIMQIMMLAAGQGTELDIRAEGPDAAEAVAALKELINRGFDEE